jgi:hypothetical protein
MVAERHSEGLPLSEPPSDGETASEKETLPLRVTEGETIALCEALREIAGEPDALAQPELLGEARSDPDAETEVDTVAERQREGLLLRERMSEGDTRIEKDALPLREPEEEALAQLEPLAEPLADRDTNEEGDAVAERHSEGLPVVDTVPRGDAERDCDPVPLRLPVTETLAHRVVLLVKVGLPLAEREARDGVPQGVAAGDADAPLRLPHSVGLPLGVALGEGLKEALPLALSEALALGEALLLAEGEPDSAPEKDGEGVADADPHALPLKVAVRAGEGLAAAVEEGDAAAAIDNMEGAELFGRTIRVNVARGGGGGGGGGVGRAAWSEAQDWFKKLGVVDDAGEAKGMTDAGEGEEGEGK